MSTTIKHEKSSGNVFADLGLPHPEQELLKARLTQQLYRIIKARRVTQTQAGEILGIRQPQVSLLMRNRSGNFSVERLMDFLTALGHDVEVRVTPTRRDHGQLSVVVAAHSSERKPLNPAKSSAPLAAPALTDKQASELALEAQRWARKAATVRARSA